MKILVTGGAGFIGSNVADGLIEAGHQVLVVDNLYTGKRSNVNPEARFFQLDIRAQEIADLIKRERPDIINHHAAQISVPASVSDPVFDAEINIKGLLNLLEAARLNSVGKFIFISSGGAIYGEAPEYPTSENCPPRPLSPYAVSKFSSEHYLDYYRYQYGLDYTTLRYANVYGPRQIPHGEAGVVAIFMNNLIKERQSTLNFFEGEERGMVRDYCFVGDIVRANLLALDRGSGDFLNIGTGVGTRTLDLYEIIFEEFKKVRPELPENLTTVRTQIARPGDLKRSCLMVEKARRVLGWVPETGLREGIRQTLMWRLNRGNSPQ
ncbi:MAG: GDP-mannose 4,6-dehydratase [Deltaproteobacteria bacterium]|nr:GDP-mannose 4,6-dehydratase [Deltaproteobacteria bacterium]MBW2112329.1 GDP-mannose 4,6-dehydratase [Deltaproteobacteria bacterium]MBW2352975.1 GDP-mannose 4,6-dehydratase [Deltaproteobacteria bacterium]